MLLLKVEKHGFYWQEASSLLGRCCCRPVCSRGREKNPLKTYWRDTLQNEYSSWWSHSVDIGNRKQSQSLAGSLGELCIEEQEDYQMWLCGPLGARPGYPERSFLSCRSCFAEWTWSSAVKPQLPLGGASTGFPPSLTPSCCFSFLLSGFLSFLLFFFFNIFIGV